MDKWRTDLDALFNPKSIAFIGASKHIGKWGHIILGNIVAGGFKGDIYPINPREDWILGCKVYRSLKELPCIPDLAMIVTPSKTVAAILKECADAGVKAAIIVPGGFSEEGEEGAALEQEIADIANTAEIATVGPNTMGIYSAGCDLYAMMPPVRPKPGPVAFVAQSGNLGTQMMMIAQDREIGFSRFVASGNEAVLFCENYLKYFGDDPDTKVIIAYIEGLDHGRDFMEVASEISRKKPLIVFKGGVTEAGMKAASSHTGAMAGSSRIFNAAFTQCGAIQAETTYELLDLACALSELPLPKSNRVGILTWGGGWGVVTADACEAAGLQVPQLSPKTIATIDKLLPKYWSRNNPIDLVGTLDREAHLKCLEALIADEGIDSAIILGVVGGSILVTAQVEIMQGAPAAVTAFVDAFIESDRKLEIRILDLMEQYKKPIIGVSIYSTYKPFVSEKGRMFVLADPHRAVKVLTKIVKYKAYLDSIEKE